MSENLPRIVWSGDKRFNCLELSSNGHGEFPDSYRLTPRGIAVTAQWLIENASTDFEDCEACGVVAEHSVHGYCPVHYGFAQGVEAVGRKLRAISDDPEVLALIPEPRKEPESDDD